MNEHEHEPVRGLPEYLPRGEQMVWQGSPSWPQMALRVFHVRKVAIYFTLLAAARAAILVAEGTPGSEALAGASWLLMLGGIAVLVLALLARMYASTTIYTMTNRRLVMRFGVALPMMINIPWHKIDAVDLRQGKDGHGDIALQPGKEHKMSYWLLWPHAKPWHFKQVQPMLRCLDQVGEAADMLQRVIGSPDTGTFPPLPRAHAAPARSPSEVAVHDTVLT